MLVAKRYLSGSTMPMAKNMELLAAATYQPPFYDKPSDLILSRGSGSILYDDTNNKEYIDFTAGIAVTSLGHANPSIAEILSKQARNLLHTSNLYYNVEAIKLCEKLVEKTKAFNGQYDSSNVFLANSGAEANEGALKFAKKYAFQINPKKQGVVAFKNSFHGRTIGAVSVTANENYRLPFGDLLPHVSFLDAKGSVEKIQDYLTTNADRIAALIIEPIQGEGGIFPIPQETLISLRKTCAESDIVVIYDEVQCGMGRTGKLWAHSFLPKEAHPDIFTSAKALGNGFPIGATIVNKKINSALSLGDHGSTYGGNPMACAVSNYVLDTIANTEFLKMVNSNAQLFEKELNTFRTDMDLHVEEIRGRGLIIGIELDAPVAGNITGIARKNGLLVATAGKNTIRIVPALNIPETLINKGLTILKHSIKEAFQGK